MYKQPASNTTNFLESYNRHISTTNRAIILGDFNLNLLNSTRPVVEYKKMLQENNMKIINNISIKFCTRATSSSKTIIDHIATNLSDNTFKMVIFDSALSDHKQIYFEINRSQPNHVRREQYKSINDSKLLTTVRNLLSKKNIQNYEDLEVLITDSVLQNKTKRTKISNSPRKEWFHKSLTILIDERNQMWTKLKKSWR